MGSLNMASQTALLFQSLPVLLFFFSSIFFFFSITEIQTLGWKEIMQSLCNVPQWASWGGSQLILRDQCWPWQSEPGSEQSCRSCKGCARPEGNSPDCPLQTGGHHSPRTGSTGHGSHDPGQQCVRSPLVLGPA